MMIGWPQGIMLALMALSVAVHIRYHGEPRSPHDGGLAIVGFLLSLALLGWGGFFR